MAERCNGSGRLAARVDRMDGVGECGWCWDWVPYYTTGEMIGRELAYRLAEHVNESAERVKLEVARRIAEKRG